MEFAVEFAIDVPPGAEQSEVERRQAAEAAAADRLASRRIRAIRPPATCCPFPA